MRIHDQAFILKKALSGEHHQVLSLFMREQGLRYVLMRRSRTPSPSGFPDLFEKGEVIISQKSPDGPSYLVEFHQKKANNGLGRSYRALQAASRLSAFFEKNLVHMEHFGEAWDLFGNALASFQSKERADVILLKALVLFARSEGYPVIASWLNEQPSRDREILVNMLQSPVESAELDSPRVRAYTADLLRFFDHHTDLLVGNLPAFIENCT